MHATPEDYRQQLRDLLPPGPVWNREDGSVLANLLLSFADELARVHNRALQLIEEQDVRTTLELIDDWERVMGLPEPCVAVPTTLEERRNALEEKMTRLGGASTSYFINLAASVGYTITITEFHGVVGSEYLWQVNAGTVNFTSIFKAGNSVAGDPLRAWGNDILECLITRLKPAHTRVQFAYT